MGQETSNKDVSTRAHGVGSMPTAVSVRLSARS
jgi:hypothetical protein